MGEPSRIFNYIRFFLLVLGLALAVFVVKISLNALLSDKIPVVEQFVSVKGDPEKLQQLSLLRSVAEKVKVMVPPDACLEVSRVPVTLLLAFRYYVYPLKFVVPEVNDFHSMPRKCNGKYFVDLNDQIKTVPKDWHPVQIYKSLTLYSIDGSPVYPARPIAPAQAPWSGWAQLVFFLFQSIIGVFLLGGFFPHLGKWPLSGKLGAGFLFGFIGVTLPFWLLALMRVPLSDVIVYSGMVILLIMSFMFMKWRGGEVRIFFARNPYNFWEYLCGLLGCGMVAVFFLMIAAFPVGIVDEVHIWLLKAKIFYELRILNFDYTEIITNYYPVFWPLNLTLQFIFTGGNHDLIAKLSTGLIFISALGLLKAAAMFLGVGRKTSWLVVAIFIVCFNHWTFFTALTENILIAMVMLSVFFLIDWFKTNSAGSLYATLLALIGLCGVKFEGTVLVVFFLMGALIAKWGKITDLWASIKSIFPLAFALLVQPFWLCWLDLQGAHYSIFHLRREPTPENYITVMQMTVMYLSETMVTVIIIFLAILFSFLARNSRPWSSAEKFLLVLVFGMVLFAYSAGLCWTNVDFVGYYSEVWLRLLSRAMPFLVLLWSSRVLNRHV